MSAIYGIIDLNGTPVRKDAVNDFMQGYSDCKIDKHEHKQLNNALMGCELQYFNKEAHNEILPIIDEENHLFFTASSVLDNREYLLKELSITDQNIPDGTLTYKAFLKWGIDCASHLRGIFSYVAYDYKSNEVTLAVDQFANVCLFYHVRDNIVYFSTLLMPLVMGSGLKFELNQKWLVDSISALSPCIMFDTTSSAYKDIYKLECGSTIKIGKNSKPVITSYYNPVKEIKTDYSMTEEKCKEQLFATLSAAVKSSIRTDANVASQLSSGLDSTSIASLAAPMLAEEGKKLYSFTSIPLSESTHVKDKYHIDDESVGVPYMVNAYPNIEPSFVECRDKNILNQGKHIVDIWELPCQSAQNAVWIDEIYQQAYDKGCRVILCGATGNCTLSAGSFLDLFFYQVRRFHPIKASKDFMYFCHKNKIRTKAFVKSMFKNYLYYLKVKYTPYMPDNYKHVLTRKDLGDSLDLPKRMFKKQMNPKPWNSLRATRKNIYLKNAYSQIGEIDTKYILRHGVIMRDPMRNVEFINFLMSLPMEFFVNKDYERRLVRDFFEGIVPDEIRLDILHRGRQSADNMFRVSKDWNEYKPIISDALHSALGKEYFDQQRVDDKLLKLNINNLEENNLDVRICIDSYLFLYFVSKLKEYT